MKKLLTALLVLFLSFSLTACGKDENNNSNEKNQEQGEVNNGENNEEALKDIELYSDDTKMVFKIEDIEAVYYYEGETITAYHAYAKYPTVADANIALAAAKQEENETIDKAYVKGTYLVIEYNKSLYENLTTSNVRLLYSTLEQTKKG